jgi:hypothetical protein
MKKRGLVVICTILLLLSGCSPATTPVGGVEDEIAIYAAVVRQITGPDDTFGGTLEKPIIYLISETNDAVGDPSLPTTEPQILSAEVQEGISAALSDLPSEIRWIASRDQVELDETGQAVDGGVFVTLGNIHPQEDGTVQVASSIYVANLAAGGKTYVLENQDGTWAITGTTGAEWIS